MDKFRIHPLSFVPSLLMVLAAAATAPGAVIYVDDSAPPGGDGATWNTAYNDLQAALAMAVSGDEIRVARGTYKPAPDADRFASFHLLDGVAILGGYAGYGWPNPDARNVTQFVTTLSGDLLGNDNSGSASREDNTQYVVVGDGTGPTTILDGFTIKAGAAIAPDGLSGGGAGIRIVDGSPTVRSCTITDHRAETFNENRIGAGVYISLGSPKFENCTISYNRYMDFPSSWWPIDHGGGIAVSGGAPEFFDCEIRNNRAGDGTWNYGSTPGCFGGGAYCTGNATPLFVGCRFLSNRAGSAGSSDGDQADQGGDGGGIYLGSGVQGRLVNCVFSGNRAGDGSDAGPGWYFWGGRGGHGGGAYAGGPTEFINCTFTNNDAGLAGGGTFDIYPGNGGSGGGIYAANSVTIANCSFMGNRTGAGGHVDDYPTDGPDGQGGAVRRTSGTVTVVNSILWKNYQVLGDSTATTTETAGVIGATYSCIRDWTGGGAGMITADPLFVNETTRNLRLTDYSPCIDAGDNGAVPPDYGDLDGDMITAEATPRDLDLNTRFFNNGLVPDTGTGTPPIVDMGAFESLTSPDCNDNGIDDTVEIAAGSTEDCNGDFVPDECQPDEDCNTNGIRDICDIGAGASNDVDLNLIPDECQPDCNGNGIPDAYELATGASLDCNLNALPDECDVAAGTSADCDANGVPDECQPDCNGNATADVCDIAAGTSTDCNANDMPDECEPDDDCNTNGTLDECDIASGYSADVDGNGVPDECEPDCNGNSIPDAHDLSQGTSADCNGNSVPDDCELAAGTFTDCNNNGLLDDCEALSGDITSEKITDSEVGDGDAFGSSVSLSGGRFLVGASLAELEWMNQGDAYVYAEQSGSWVREGHLFAEDPDGGHRFGLSVALNNEVAVSGAYQSQLVASSAGAAFVFRWNGSNWSQEQVLLGSSTSNGDQFGISTAVEGDAAVIGAWRDDATATNSGTAFVFRHAAGSWTEEIKLVASDGASNDFFGYAVSISGNVIGVGARGDNDRGTDSGSAYVFRHNGSSWVQSAKLLADDGAAYDDFGGKIVVLNDVIAVGARLHDSPNGTDSGAVYIYRYDGAQWQQEAKLVAPDGAAGDQFGVSVHLDVNMLAVGAHLNDEAGSNAGAAYVFQYEDGTWRPFAKLEADDAAPDDQFGISVAIEDRTIVVGARYDDDQGADSGSVYVYEIAPTDPGDFDRDGDVDLADYAGMADCLGGPEAAPGPGDAACAQMCLDAFDLDDDGDIDLLDFAEFETEF